MQIKIKKLHPNAILPTMATPGSAAYDLHACIDVPVTIEPGETAMIGTGLAIQPPRGIAALILARSGKATKRGLAPANKVGLADSDYIGMYMVALHNHGKQTQIIYPNDRIAQLMFVKHEYVDWDVVDELDETERGDRGCGSTGVQ
jgi:dUTP pyrophosphatase